MKEILKIKKNAFLLVLIKRWAFFGHPVNDVLDVRIVCIFQSFIPLNSFS